MSQLFKSLMANALLKNKAFNCFKNALRSSSANCPDDECAKVDKCKEGDEGKCNKKKNKQPEQPGCPPGGETKRKGKPEGSVWDHPSCNKLPCSDEYPKFDYLFKYDQTPPKVMQTWVSCPKRRKAKKVVCKFKTKKYPPLPKRDPKACKGDNSSACAFQINSDLMKCQAKGDPKCVRLSMPGCCSARIPPNCRVGRKQVICKKVDCPTKAFSECQRQPSNKSRPNECNCLAVRPMCEIYRVAKAKGFIK